MNWINVEDQIPQNCDEFPEISDTVLCQDRVGHTFLEKQPR